MFRLKGSQINITVGSAIDSSVFDNSQSNEEWSARLRQYCHTLKTNPDAVFNPELKATLPEK